MDSILKILVLGEFPGKTPFDARYPTNHNIVFLPVSSDISLVAEEAPDIVVIDSSETEDIERVLKLAGQGFFKSEPVFLVVVKEEHVCEFEKLLAACSDADYIYEPLGAGAFARRIEFLARLASVRSENRVLLEMVKKSRFIGHEINNPLTSVIGNSEMLLEEELDGADKKMVDIIRKEGLRIARLVDDMMEDSRLDDKVSAFKPDRGLY